MFDHRVGLGGNERMRLLQLPGVFGPISDAWMLSDALRRERIAENARVLDLCSGSGVLAIRAAQLGASATAIDVSLMAVTAVKLNARLNRMRVDVRRGELFASVEGEAFEIIVCNPPYVPSAEPSVPDRGPARAWAAGSDGRLVIDRICGTAAGHLQPGGALLMVHSSLIGEEETTRRLVAGGMQSADVVARHRGPLGPLMLEQQRLGTISPTLEHEDVVVIRAQAPA
jgi:release factor glutamine methyltransferase